MHFNVYKFHSDARLTPCDDMFACIHLAMSNEKPGWVDDFAASGQSLTSLTILHCGLHSSYVYGSVSKGCANQDIAISMQSWSSSLNHCEGLEIDVDRIGPGSVGSNFGVFSADFRRGMRYTPAHCRLRLSPQ
jgi:hypothetical protein